MFGNGFGRDVWVNAQLSDDGRHVLYSADHGWGRSEIYVGGIAPDSKIEPIVTDIDAHFNCTMVGDRILVHTDWKAPKYRLMLADMDQPAPAKWREIVPEGKDVLQDVTYIGGKIYATYLHDVVTEIKTFTLNGEPTGNVPLPGIGSASVSGEPDGKEAFITFTSFTTPPTTFRDDIKTGDRDVWSKPTVDIDPGAVRRRAGLVHVEGQHDTDPHVPRPQEGPRDRHQPSRPALRLRRLQRRHHARVPRHGGRVRWSAAACSRSPTSRGGPSSARPGTRPACSRTSRTCSTTSCAAADWLIANHYTTPKRLAIQGGSNGGLLVGAVLTQRPELYRAVLCQFPDLDMVRYYQFKNNNPPALLEYGNASDPEQFKYLVAYSPYQNVKDGTAYPAVMLTSGDADTRVPPLQARKMTARLQARDDVEATRAAAL